MGHPGERYQAQSLVEFALIAPLIIIMFVGLASFGFLLYAHVQVTNATREAARAASLYYVDRFHYTSCEDTTTFACPPYFGDGEDVGPGSTRIGACWTLRQWVENAVVEHKRTGADDGAGANGGCATADYVDTKHAFGRLSPARCPADATVGNCWVEAFEMMTGTSTTLTTSVAGNLLPGVSGDDTPPPGRPLQINLVYRFNVPVVGDFLGIITNPIAIKKSVVMKMQYP